MIQGTITAVLGPTNTGKTHFAMERMLGHASGMIGFPLRLLARENYDRAVRLKGADQVALITGEEKIVPPQARWLVCTVESMPTDRRVACLVVDEIQLCADPDRGHVFTDRLLHARGSQETLFLGAETIKPLIRRLVPQAQFVTRPRLSCLSYDGPRKLNRLPPRTAIVAFSAAQVYAMAEYVRRQKGGAAVVLGALSPRTRNAQVGLYQAGEVDTIIATDAIGMGLNMDVDHVAFAGLRKFDGRAPRDLDPTEVAQIAGRAGRNRADGTFGTTADISVMPAELVDAVENHRFAPLKWLSWRNSHLRFVSVPALLADLEQAPNQPGLVRARDADDHLALAHLAQDPQIIGLTNHPERVKLLWDVCQVPDFRKVMTDSHARLLGQLFRHLTGPGRRLPTDWLAAQVARLDRSDGDLDSLIGRIAGIRTWTYVANRPGWVSDPAHWQQRTRVIEDMLSDALHDRLTQRFIDRRTTLLLKRMKGQDGLVSDTDQGGQVVVEGQFVGQLNGFCFTPDQTQGGVAGRTVLAAAAKALAPEITRRIDQIVAAPDQAFALDDQGLLLWQNQAVARLVAGPTPLHPRVQVIAGDLVPGVGRQRIQTRLTAWVADHGRRVMPLLFALADQDVAGPVRGVCHVLGESLGTVPVAQIQALINGLTAQDRDVLNRLGVRISRMCLFMPSLLKAGPAALAGLYWAIHGGHPVPTRLGRRQAVRLDADLPAAAAQAQGYMPLGAWAVRADMLDRLVGRLKDVARSAGHDAFALPPDLAGLLGLRPGDLALLLPALGYGADGAGHWRAIPKRPARRPRSRPASDNDSPFAILKRAQKSD